MSDAQVIDVAAPWFEDFSLGQRFEAPGVTLTSGHAALHQAMFGDRLLLPLDQPLCNAVTGEARALAHPSLVANVAIGQTTHVSQRVKANLFYRGLRFLKPVFIDDTLRTTTSVVALRQNRPQPGRDATGVIGLEIDVRNQDGEHVMKLWRAPMLPCRDPQANTGHNDSLDAIGAHASDADLIATVPADWELQPFRARAPTPCFADVVPGTRYRIGARDTITGAPELVRLTLNLAMAHLDSGASYLGQRLVYGGHTISMAFAQTLRALPGIVTVCGWRSCDHLAPVLEGDLLRTEVSVVRKIPVPAGGGIVELRAETFANRPETAETRVLDWVFHVLLS